MMEAKYRVRFHEPMEGCEMIGYFKRFVRNHEEAEQDCAHYEYNFQNRYNDASASIDLEYVR